MKSKKNIILGLLLVITIAIPTSAMTVMLVNSQSNTTYIIPIDDYPRNDDLGAIRLVNALLKENVTVKWAQEPFTVGGMTYPAGTFYIETPFTTKNGISSDVMMQWFMWEAKMNRVFRIDTTTETVTANATDLVMPHIVMYYDKYTYDNCLNHYNRFKSLGFEVRLATAASMTGLWWNDTLHPLHDANVFIMPGGAIHLWQFPYGDLRTWAIGNISDWVAHGGGYAGPCAGASEALNKTPYTALKLVDADYAREWFDGALSPPGQGPTEYKNLIGPMYISVDESSHPVMFGYGPNATRPGYGPEIPIYYYGGPAFRDLGGNITVLGTFSRPISQNLEAAGRTNNIWGCPAILAADYGSGRCVLFSPHPEWPGPGARLYAQAVFWIAQNRIDTSYLDPSTTIYNPSKILNSRVTNILSTAAEIAPILQTCARVATDIVNFRAGDAYNPIGFSYDEVLMYYYMQLTEHLNVIKRDTVKFDYEYYKYSLLRDSVSATTRDTIDYAMALMDSFFNYSESFPVEPHVIVSSDYYGNVFTPWTSDPTQFSDLVDAFVYMLNATEGYMYESAFNYTRDYYNYYQEIFTLNKTAPSSIPTNQSLERWGLDPATYAGSNASEVLVAFYAIASAETSSMYSRFNRHLDIVQFKIGTFLMDMMIIGQRVREVCSYLNFILATEIGAWAYAAAEWQATVYQPGGPLA